MYESTCQLFCPCESIFSPVRPKMGEEGVQIQICLCFFCYRSQETHDPGSKATESFTLSREEPFAGVWSTPKNMSEGCCCKVENFAAYAYSDCVNVVDVQSVGSLELVYPPLMMYNTCNKPFSLSVKYFCLWWRIHWFGDSSIELSDFSYWLYWESMVKDTWLDSTNFLFCVGWRIHGRRQPFHPHRVLRPEPWTSHEALSADRCAADAFNVWSRFFPCARPNALDSPCQSQPRFLTSTAHLVLATVTH